MKVETILQEADIPTLESEILLAHILRKTRTWLMANPQYKAAKAEVEMFQELVKRRKKHEPIAQIVGTKEFYGRTFAVTPDVLIPRPSTEVLIDEVLDLLEQQTPSTTDADTQILISCMPLGDLNEVKTIVDIGTGSGCIAVTLMAELPDMHCIATDVSTEALEVAQKNAHAFGVNERIEFRKGANLDPLKDLKEPFLLISNPPYIPSGEELMPDVQDFEPHTALFAGEDGTDVLVKILKQAKKHPFCRGIVLEHRREQLAGLDLDS